VSTSSTYDYPSDPSTVARTTTVGGITKHWFNMTWTGNKLLAWECPSLELAEGLKLFADAVEKQGLHKQNTANARCNSTSAPSRAPSPAPTPAPTSTPAGPPCSSVNDVGVCTQHTTGTCYIAPTQTYCGPVDYVVNSTTGQRVYAKVLDWFDNCLTTTLKCNRASTNGGISSYVYTGTIGSSVTLDGSTWTFKLLRPANSNALTVADIAYACPNRDSAVAAKNVSFFGFFLVIPD
jgi:hypothetical protein